jgi:hypothetical protein
MPIWLGKMFATWIFKAIKRKVDLKKIDNYVNKPNELDKQMKQVQKTADKFGKYIEELEKDVAILKGVSHPPIFEKSDLRKIERRLKKLEK